MRELPGVEKLAYLLSKARSASEVDQIWMSTGLKGTITAIVALEDYKRANIPGAVKKYAKGDEAVLVPYFSGGEVYFLNDRILFSYHQQGRADFKIDYSFMFDTNMASYVDALMRGRPLKTMHHRVVAFVDDILNDDLNFDYFYYMAENVKEVKNIHQCAAYSPLKFWKTLSKKFRNNLVSLQLFRSIDCAEYKRTSNPKPRFTHREAARRAINFSHSYYASEEGRAQVLSFALMQRVILLQVIGMVKIQLSSNKSAKHKISEFFDYVNDVVGVYLDREAIVAHKYFVDPRLISMLEKIKKSQKAPRRLLKKLDNIAWDMAAPRLMETLIMSQGMGDFFIPMFISFDGGLKQVLKAYEVKGVVFDSRRGGLIPLPRVNTEDYFKAHGCADALLKISEKRDERSDKPTANRDTVHQLIKREYGVLRKLLSTRGR
ncbi:hypothetical protein HBO18_03255 [Pseudomonas lactis]|uniref:Uncharacterized protein n=2 Tax=Pseudomonas lactis TaxID=1615674 RepID=A0A7Y1LBL9_9PSED|nr:hypothetical protein [Pseudomonas lactis]NNA43136.1 hypothetical protein [Pseudomonas lactis]